MAENYMWGVILAIMGGIANNTGTLFQKYAVNQVSKENREKKFLKTLIKDPYWIIGIILMMGASGVLFMFAQAYIGATMVPGLSSIGIIVLTIGAVKILHERLNKLEIFGIIITMFAILFFGLSNLEITQEDMINFEDIGFVTRILIYSVILAILWLIFHKMSRRNIKGKTLLLGFGANLPFTLSNIWLQPMIFLAGDTFRGDITVLSMILFIISIVIVVIVNTVAIGMLQDAYKYGDASKIMPIGQIPQQISPIIIYFLIYMKIAPSSNSILYICIGVSIILVSGFILGRKQGQLETME